MPILLVKVNNNDDAPDGPFRYRAGEIIAAFDDNHEFGTKEVPEAGNFYHVAITDKTLVEVQTYMQDWTHDPTTEQVSNQGNRRLIEVTSSMVSATGKNAFTQAGVVGLMATINNKYQNANAVYDSHTNTAFRFLVTVPQQGIDELIEMVNEAVRDMQYARRRWYITQSGMTYLSNNGGTVSGTAAQVSGYVRDGLLD